MKGLRSHQLYQVWGQVQVNIDSLQIAPEADSVQLVREQSRKQEAEPEVLSGVDSSVPETLGAPEMPTLQL